MILSDHGFTSFRYGVDLNRWLEENGYLTVTPGGRDQKHLEGIDWSHTRAYALGLAGLFLNIKDREAQGIVPPGLEADQLCKEIAEKLTELFNPAKREKVVKNVYHSQDVYQGPYKNEAPDLIVGYNRGYRAGWETAVGRVTDTVIHENTRPWSGDHCIDHTLVPGVFFCNRPLTTDNPRLIDIGPTVLDMFGIPIPSHIDGKPLFTNGREKGNPKHN
jgi:predicted AlkP superfamily phosphohydrolase/phosphomutase